MTKFRRALLLVSLTCAVHSVTVMEDGRPSSSSSSAAIIGDQPRRNVDNAVLTIDDVDASSIRVLEKHKVVYTEAPTNQKFRSTGKFNPRGMEHVYTITKTFLRLVQREDLLPPSINVTELEAKESEYFEFGPGEPPSLPPVVQENWQEFLLQYIGVVTIAICGLLTALALPLACCCFFCCRCSGKCGAYPEHFDKRSDACKRFSLGVLLAIFVVAATFGVVVAFVTDFFVHDGLKKLPDRIHTSLMDTDQYMDNTGKEVDTLLVTNFAELEEVLNNVLEESGPILKSSLAEVTQAVAIDDLTNIVSNLGVLKRHLKEIQKNSVAIQDKVRLLGHGLNQTTDRLMSALRQCATAPACADFLKEFDVESDLAVAQEFSKIPESLPDLRLLMEDISQLMENDIEKKVKDGQGQLDRVKVDIERQIGDVKPKIKAEIRNMGRELEVRSSEIQGYLNKFSASVKDADKDVPATVPYVEEYGGYMFYIGLGMAVLVLLILICYVLALFCGFCGKRPGNVYGDDCCNTGTGANWLLAAVYLTFLFSFVLLLVATVMFLVGSTADKVACEALRKPNESEIFKIMDRMGRRHVFESVDELEEFEWGLVDVIDKCHRNQTIYDILPVAEAQGFNIEELRNWREKFSITATVDKLKSKIVLGDLDRIQILSPEAERELTDLAESEISDLNFSQYTRLLEEKMTATNLIDFTGRLRQIKERLTPEQSRLIGNAIEVEALFLEQMQNIVMNMTMDVKNLVRSVEALQKEAENTKPNLREALLGLIGQARKATTFLRTEGPTLVETLVDRYIEEIVGLIDQYVDRVITYTRTKVGQCHPMSRTYNSTVIAVCNEIVDPFNGLWASVGWCVVLYLLSMGIAVSLNGLYKKSEPYPGPLVEQVPDEAYHSSRQQSSSHHQGGKKSKRRSGGGHRRNPSEYLPDSAVHYRAGYAYNRDNGGGGGGRFHDMAPRNNTALLQQSSVNSTSAIVNPHSGAGGANSNTGNNGPPRYSSNPALEMQAAAAAGGGGAVGGGGGNTATAPHADEYERPPPYYFHSNDATLPASAK